jgi:hypothetical protein
MEAAHMAANKRELEITKHVSLFQLDPRALLALRETGSCDFHLPEVLFDMDFPGHFYRRIKSVRITIPCVVGPYTNVSATLSLTDSWTRRSTALSPDAGEPIKDTIAAPQIAIATSSANQDGGAFELNFNDPRYLPFEGAGAISSWHLELPTAIRPFDYATISDVVMHVSYTARDGGKDLKDNVNAELINALNDLKALVEEGEENATMSRLFSLRQEFPDAWNELVNASGGPVRRCTLQLSKRHFPSFLDYEWRTSDDETIHTRPGPQPITLDVKGFSAHLSPTGPLPEDAADIRLNETQAIGLAFGIPEFDLINAPGTLSSTSIDNTAEITCELTLDGVLRLEDWNDVYLLVDYEVTTG